VVEKVVGGGSRPQGAARDGGATVVAGLCLRHD
jgi:hypothetical protein